MQLRRMQNADTQGKTALVRVDFNVPLDNGVISDDRRIRAVLPTIRWLLDHGARVVLVTHLGRPEGHIDEALRLDPIADRLADLLGHTVIKLADSVGEEIETVVVEAPRDAVILLENIRFHREENTNEPAFARQLAGLADLFVNDAFATMHRAHASNVGVADHLPAYAGLLVQREIEGLSPVLESPKRPYVAVIGGKKAQSKLGPLKDLVSRVDEILIGGGVAMSFLHAEGFDVGASSVDEKVLNEIRTLREAADAAGVAIHLPVDVVCAERLAADAETLECPVEDIPQHWHGFDIGKQTATLFAERIAAAATVVWTGPMGAFEIAPFSNGTKRVGEAIGTSNAYSVIGGGETGEAVAAFDLEDRVTYVSTGGGACLAMLRGKHLPAMEALLES